MNDKQKSGPARSKPSEPAVKVIRDARDFALLVIRDVVWKRLPLDERLEQLMREFDYRDLSPSDRGLVRAISTVATRWMGLIRKTIRTRLREGIPTNAGQFEAILIAATAQILFLDVPDYAAVDTAITKLRADPKGIRYVSLANAVLRGIARDKAAIVEECNPLTDNTPEWLATRWVATYGEETALAIARAHCFEPSLDISVKSDPVIWAEKLGATVLPNGSLRLTGRGAVPDLPGFADGEWWVQDVVAAIPAQLLDVSPGETVADICAAPGGKTAQLAVAGGVVTAVDRSAPRMKRLEENAARLKLDIKAVVADWLTFEGGPFKKILLDAPCSSTGTLRRHPDVAWNKTLSDIGSLCALQSKLLDKAWLLLEPGGTLVYATCSLEREEGEAQIDNFLKRTPDAAISRIGAIEVGGINEFITSIGFLRALPSHMQELGGCDGFFAARLIKR